MTTNLGTQIYSGAAAIIGNLGDEKPVQVELYQDAHGPLEPWHGTGETEEGWNPHFLGTVALRLPDGSYASARVVQVTMGPPCLFVLDGEGPPPSHHS